MDAGRIWLVPTIASVSFALAFAAPHSSRAAGQSGWTGAPPPAAPSYTSQPSYTAPTNTAPNYTAPTYGAPSYDRYGQPTGATQPVYGQPATISQRSQNAVSETATTLRDGFDATVRAAKDGTQGLGQQFQDWRGTASQQMQAAGSTIRSTASQAVGTNANQPRFTNPFAAPAAPPSTSPSARTQPPPWTNSSAPTTTMATAPAQTWPTSATTTASSAPVAPTGDWSSIGSSVASPPMLIPQLSTANDTPFNSGSPVTTVVGRNAPTFPAEPPSARQDNTRSVLAPQSQPPTATRSGADDWTWGNPPDTSAATIGGNASTPPRAETNRDCNITPSIAAAPQDTKKTSTNNSKEKDLWADDPWAKPSPTSPTAPRTSATIAAPTITASPNKQPSVATNNAQPSFPTPVASPSHNPPAPPTMGTAPSNVNIVSAQSPVTPVAGTPTPPKATQPSAPTEEKPWVLMIAAVLGLAGSLAANFFLGWSYLDTRQKYQSLVRRTADTFRRTKQAAA